MVDKASIIVADKIAAAKMNNATIPILYESERILIIQKPPGIPHHTSTKKNSTTLGIIHRIREQQKRRLWGVHRLDQVTSGILVLAKDSDMASQLTRLFAQHNITKYYVGISQKPPKKKKQGWVVGGMQKGRNKSWLLTRGEPKNMARTRFFTTRMSHNLSLAHVTCILFRPYTGKTHQLRVAAKAMGIPLWGDPIYSDGTLDKNCRTHLHACGIQIPALEDQANITLWNPPTFLDVDNLALSKAIGKLMRKHASVEMIQAIEYARDDAQKEIL
eukprot:CAMPEP_0194206094 /NCGR_PEP_ID=MMETSP0156-20130528/5210_1 /TAXON_ID=33649 /ORGANISM="Thalassionema nitzschioides, Strain L26-B" /LENGTH=273 /DNA_ID=CAMNT_0038932523 /DNA_START=290 /DNA_END=1111 /DNA_ORIENTATION=-